MNSRELRGLEGGILLDYWTLPERGRRSFLQSFSSTHE